MPNWLDDPRMTSTAPAKQRTVLFLTDPDRDYGADYLYSGFCDLGDTVVDWPAKPTLHWASEPAMDCDLNYPRPPIGSTSLVLEMLDGGEFDLIVAPSLRRGVQESIGWLRRNDAVGRNADRIVAYDAEDSPQDTQALFRELLGIAPRAYFKRELPLGATWARPLPFGYPERRVVAPGVIHGDDPISKPRIARAIYAVEIWPWAVGGLREHLGTALRRSIGADVRMTYNGERRLAPSKYHALNQHALVAVSPAGQGWGTNRHLEIVADGCCPVIEKPWVEWPDAFVEGEECLYFTNQPEAVEAVRGLLAEPERAHTMAQAAAAKWLTAHTTRRRAETVWAAVR